MCDNKYLGCNENNCKGCKCDPNNSTMTYEEFREEYNYFNCDSCVYCKPSADMDNVESICKRLDHKKISFSKAVFYSYDCGQRNGCVCADFKPKKNYVWLYNHWRDEFIIDYISQCNGLIDLCLDHNWEVRYQVRKKDFVLGDFINDDGTLKAVSKTYYKRSNSSPTGYKLVKEEL